jgi:hypothetical protein
MAHVLRHADLPRLAREARAVAGEARRAFGRLDPAQLNWKPSPTGWSVGQCLDHLVRSTTAYFPLFEAVQAGRKRPTLWERVPVLPGLMASLLIRVLDPERGMKVEAPAAWRPAQGAVEPGILDAFVLAQERLVELMTAIPADVAWRTVITSPVAGVVTYRLLDAYRIMVVHALLHLGQARRVTEATGFPHAAAPP